MKIEIKDCDWMRCHKGDRNTGKVNKAWRYVHKKARITWKRDMYNRKYEMLIKHI